MSGLCVYTMDESVVISITVGRFQNACFNSIRFEFVRNKPSQMDPYSVLKVIDVAYRNVEAIAKADAMHDHDFACEIEDGICLEKFGYGEPNGESWSDYFIELPKVKKACDEDCMNCKGGVMYV